LQICCRDVSEAKRKFLTLYSFQEFGYMVSRRNSEKVDVLKHRDIFLIICKAKEDTADTINDISFCVDSLTMLCKDVHKYGGIIIEKPHKETCRTFSSSYKQCQNCEYDKKPCLHSIEKAIIKSSVGNLQHTLIDKNGFTGDFLPGFIRTEKLSNFTKSAGSFDCIDHIALAVPCDETVKHMMWYKNCLHLLKFDSNKLEKESGIVIRAKQGRGLKLFTLVEHPCSDECVSEEVEVGSGKVKFVFCESLTREGMVFIICTDLMGTNFREF